MAVTLDNEYAHELGKALCDRAGLPLNQIGRDWSAEGSGNIVHVQFTAHLVMSKEDFTELQRVVQHRIEGP